MLNKRLGIVMYQTSTSKGQELVAQRMVREFNKMGQKAVLITSLFHDGKEVVPPASLQKGPGYLYTEDSVLKIPVIRVESSVAKWPPRRIVFRDFIHTLERIADKFELNVLITHSTLWNGPEDVAKFVTWRRDMRNVGGYQDPIVFCHMSHLQEASPQRYSLAELTFRTAWNKFSLSKIMEIANLTLVVTPFEKLSKIKMGVKPEKCFLLPGGVDDSVFLNSATEDTVDFLKRHNISPDVRIVASLGTLEERKNPKAVLKVAEKLAARKDLHFVFAGRGDSPYAEEFEVAAKRLPNVTYVGEIDDEEKVRLIKAAYLNIIMSRLEALGIAQLEFMYCGIPVITSATGGQSWLIQNGVEGLHTRGPDDIAGAVNAITQLLDNDRKYAQLAANAKEKACRLTIARLIKDLDAAIDTEMVRESGLTAIPSEVQATLINPEHALKTWVGRTSGIVATNKRLFIRRGVISRTVTELRYGDIKSIEYSRRYPWTVLLTGALVSAFFLIVPALKPVFSGASVSLIENWIDRLAQSTPPWITPAAITYLLLPLLPTVTAIIVFLARAKLGFKLYCPGLKPVYLSLRFKEAIGFIREKMDSLTS